MTGQELDNQDFAVDGNRGRSLDAKGESAAARAAYQWTPRARDREEPVRGARNRAGRPGRTASRRPVRAAGQDQGSDTSPLALNNRDRVGRGLDLLASGLGPFVDARMASAPAGGSDWMTALATREQSRYRGRHRLSLCDCGFLLQVVTEEWGAFRDHLSRIERGFATELRDTRNRWAHGEPFSADDTYRALDTTERLLAAVGAAEQASQVRRVRLDFPRCTGASCRWPGAGATEQGHAARPADPATFATGPTRAGQ